jgi:hypothetical protein
MSVLVIKLLVHIYDGHVLQKLTWFFVADIPEDVDIVWKFVCMDPFNPSMQVLLKGPTGYDAAVYCTAVSAIAQSRPLKRRFNWNEVRVIDAPDVACLVTFQSVVTFQSMNKHRHSLVKNCT